MGCVKRHLNPPKNIRLVVTTDIITSPIMTGDVIGYFEADTPNKLGYPEGISILGGKDADFFERVYNPNHKVIGLGARELLSAEIIEQLRDLDFGHYGTLAAS